MNLPHILHDKRTLSISLILFLSTFLIYFLSYRGEGKYYNSFVLLADAILHGRLYLLSNPPWLNELIKIGKHFYVPYSPMPAVFLIPFVALFGTTFLQPILSILIGALNVSLCFIVIKKYFNSEGIALLTSILYGFGTIQWYHAEVGSSWYISQIIAMFLIWIMLLESVSKRRLFLIGLFIGFAFLSRIPTIFALIFPLIFLKSDFRLSKSLLLYFVGISIGVVLYGLYNFFSFGSFLNSGYWLIPNVLNEPWYRYGIISIKYIPIHFIEIFTSLPKFSTSPPFIIPSIYVMAIWFTIPALFLILRANYRNLLEKAALLSAVLILLLNLMHGSNGFSQFGYRFIMDSIPFLLILIASGIRNSSRFLTWILVTLSIIVNLWGVVMLSFLKIWVV